MQAALAGAWRGENLVPYLRAFILPPSGLGAYGTEDDVQVERSKLLILNDLFACDGATLARAASRRSSRNQGLR